MNLTAEQLDQIEEMSYRMIPCNLIAINIEVPEYDLKEEVETVGTPARNAFYKGYLKMLVELRDKVIGAAMNGSNPAQTEVLRWMADAERRMRHG